MNLSQLVKAYYAYVNEKRPRQKGIQQHIPRHSDGRPINESGGIRSIYVLGDSLTAIPGFRIPYRPFLRADDQSSRDRWVLVHLLR